MRQNQSSAEKQLAISLAKQTTARSVMASRIKDGFVGRFHEAKI